MCAEVKFKSNVAMNDYIIKRSSIVLLALMTLTQYGCASAPTPQYPAAVSDSRVDILQEKLNTIELKTQKIQQSINKICIQDQAGGQQVIVRRANSECTPIISE